MSRPWWWERLRCPACGEDLDVSDTNGACATCGEPCPRHENVIQWGDVEDAPAPSRHRKGLAKYWATARYRLDPLASPYSPLTWLSRWRVEAYYRRALHDPALARRWAARYLDGIALPASAAVLDHGCGRGRFAAFLSSLGHRVVGQDVLAHPWWRELPTAGFAVVPPERTRLPWRLQSFDLVLDWGVIGHFPEEALSEHAAEVFAALKPGGSWVVYEANATGMGVHLNRRHYGRLHSVERVQLLATGAGFQVSRTFFEGVQSPVFPRAYSYAATHLSPRGFELGTGGSLLDRVVPPARRALWMMHLRRPS